MIYQGKAHLANQQSSSKKDEGRGKQQPGNSSQKVSSQKKGRSYSDDRGMQQFQMGDDDYGD